MPASQPSADTAVVRARIVHLLSICRAAPHGNDRHHLPVPAPHSILNRNSNFHLSPNHSLRFSLRLLFQLLTCLHSVPLGDARELAAAETPNPSAAGDGTVRFPCPACGTICSTPVDELMVDGVVRRVKQSSVKQVAAPPCDCGEGVATVHCNECNLCFCDDCNADGHKRGAKKAHARTPIASHLAAGGQSGPAPSAEAEVVMCRRHPTYPLLFFCRDEGCGIPICALCAAKDHKLHNYIDLAEAHGTAAADLQAAAEAVVGPLSEVEAAIAAVLALLTAVDASTVATKATLTVQFKGSSGRSSPV